MACQALQDRLQRRLVEPSETAALEPPVAIDDDGGGQTAHLQGGRLAASRVADQQRIGHRRPADEGLHLLGVVDAD